MGKSQVAAQPPEVKALLREVERELDRATAKFPPLNSPHEGWAVIAEEVDELWACVKENTGRSEEAWREAVQVASMALRYALDLCYPRGTEFTDA